MNRLALLLLVLVTGESRLMLGQEPGRSQSSRAETSPPIPVPALASPVSDFDSTTRVTPIIPALFRKDLPALCRQVVLVLADGPSASTGQLFMLEKGGKEGDGWALANQSPPPIAVTLGRKGLAWGAGEHQAPCPGLFQEKREGDGCSPLGIFRLPQAFGQVPQSALPQPIKLPYIHLTRGVVGVDDPHSRFYNQIVDSAKVAPDWRSAEPMSRYKKTYRLGVFVAHNASQVPGHGSCIFLHIWGWPGKTTSGCTAMSEPDLRRVVEWLDPAQDPRLVQAWKSQGD